MTGRNVNEDDSTSSSLLSRVRRNDGDAWTRFFTLYDPLVNLWCARSGLREPNIDDVKQEVFIAVRKYLVNFRKESPQDSFRAWLRTVTSTKVADFWRRHNADAVPVGGSDALHAIASVPAPSDDSRDAELAEEKGVLYRRAVDLIKTDFKAKTWMAFWRTTIDGQRANDVAVELGISKNAVHMAKSHVLRRLREEFVDLIEE